MKHGGIIVQKPFTALTSKKLKLMRNLNHSIVELYKIYSKIPELRGILPKSIKIVVDDPDQNVAYSLVSHIHIVSDGQVWIDMSLGLTIALKANTVEIFWLAPKQTTWIIKHMFEEYSDDTLVKMSSIKASQIAHNLKISAAEIDTMILDGMLLKDENVLTNRVFDVGDIRSNPDKSKSERMSYLLQEKN
jgi:hypothetical protein